MNGKLCCPLSNSMKSMQQHIFGLLSTFMSMELKIVFLALSYYEPCQFHIKIYLKTTSIAKEKFG